MDKKHMHLSVIILARIFIGTNITSVNGVITHNEFASKTADNNTVDKQTIELTVEVPTFEFDRIDTEQGLFTEITVPHEGFTTIVGKAKLPVIRQMIEIPQDSNLQVEIDTVSWNITSLQVLNLPSQIIPVQPSVPKIPGVLQEFILDTEYYENDAFFPNDIVKIVETGEMRGRRFALVEIYPVQYNPFSSDLKLMNTCEIRINLFESDMIKTYENIKRYSSPSFEKLLQTTFVNYGLYEEGLLNTINDPEGYLIIVYDNFYDEILPLVTWKEEKGYDITVTKTSDIPGGATKENIHDFIETAYDEWNVPPSYVLLVGDVAQIPTYFGQSSGTAADLYYVTMNPEDYFPDIFIGRFPAATKAHVNAMVDKTIYYEQGAISSNEWIKKAALMASTDNYNISEGTHNYVIDTFLEPNGYISDKLYTQTYGATTQQVKDTLNDGRSLAIYSGHGATTFWADGPYFSQSDVNGLINEGTYPFVCSHACVTGDFSYSECFGETWLRTSNKGGLAFWGSSSNTLWDEDDVLERKTFSAWWDDGLEWIGGMTDMGLYYLYQHYGGEGYSKYYFESYNVLGDPSVNIWSRNPSGNRVPDKPNTPDGPTKGVTSEEYTFCVDVPEDPEGSMVYLLFDWGDEQNTGWLGPYPAGTEICKSYIWDMEGSYEVKVRAKDENNYFSLWSNPLIIDIIDQPNIEIVKIKGGFGISVDLSNIIEQDITTIQWSIKIDGGIIFTANETSGIIDELKAGEKITFKSNLLFGFGIIDITVCANTAIETKTGIIIGPFVLIIQ